jgi:hypothetical protein
MGIAFMLALTWYCCAQFWFKNRHTITKDGISQAIFMAFDF